jgi:hypothetical protein
MEGLKVADFVILKIGIMIALSDWNGGKVFVHTHRNLRRRLLGRNDWWRTWRWK